MIPFISDRSPLLSRARLNAWGKLEGKALLKAVLSTRGIRVAVTSSFGTESAVLLDMVARIDPSTPVVFVDTGKLFAETHAYRKHLTEHLDLLDVRVVKASPALVANLDPDGDLHIRDPDACCQGRKVTPFALAVMDFDVLVTGRKRHHGGVRADLPPVEVSGLHVKVNPLAAYTSADVERRFIERRLPHHPLVGDGYLSIGCAPCTNKACAKAGVRSGRWAGQAKTECGIHNPHDIQPLNVGT